MKAIRTLLPLVVVAFALHAIPPVKAQNQVLPANPVPPPLMSGNPELNDATLKAAMAQLSLSLAQRNSAWYVSFTTQAPQQQQPGGAPYGFAPPVPLNSQPLMSSGIMEIHFFNPPSVQSWQNPATGQWECHVSLRIRDYRIYQPSKGWTAAQMPIHFWQWTGGIQDGGGTWLKSDTDARCGTSDGGVTEFVAAVFNVPCQNVQVSKPGDHQLPAVTREPTRRSNLPSVPRNIFRGF